MRSPVLALALLAFAAAPVSASSVSLDVSGLRTELGQRPDGTLLYRSTYHRQVSLTGTVLDDHGAPVPAGTPVHLSMRTHDGDADVALSDVVTAAGGAFSFPFTPDHGRRYIAHVDAATGIAAAASNAVRLFVAPTLRLTMRLAQRGTVYRIKGRLSLSQPRTAGHIRLLRCTSATYTHCRRIASLRARKNGAWHTSVAHHTRGRHYYLITFAPADRAVWSSASLRLAVDFR